MEKLFTVICYFFSIIASAQQINLPYSFPIKPGTKEWSNLNNEKERFDAMQIPVDTLDLMSTSALVVSCLNFPAFGYITAFDNPEEGLIFLTKKFNGLRELTKRDDAGKYLIQIYQLASTKGFEENQLNLDERFWTIKFSWLELLLSQNGFIQTLDINERIQLLLIAEAKYKLKLKSKDYSVNGLMPTVLLMSRVLHVLKSKEFEIEYSKNETLRNFISTSKMSDIQLIEKVNNFTINYLGEQNL